MDDSARNAFERFMHKVFKLIDGPCTWFRETIVLPNQKQYPYYHRKYQRVPTIDECYEGDVLCMYEAQVQFKRDREVDGFIVALLGRRKLDCIKYEGYEAEERCKKVIEDHKEALLNYFIKYGDLGAYAHVKNCYMKQKHRMVYERRKAAGTWNPEIK